MVLCFVLPVVPYCLEHGVWRWWRQLWCHGVCDAVAVVGSKTYIGFLCGDASEYFCVMTAKFLETVKIVN